MRENMLSERRHPLSKIEHVVQAALSDAVLVSLLQRYGCTIEQTTVHFPEGTTAEKILPGRGVTTRYSILLPDGVELLWKQGRPIVQPARSMLQIDGELYEQEEERIAPKKRCNVSRETF